MFVCTANKMRSASAHEIYKKDERLDVKSAGTDSKASTPLTNDLLLWADSIIVMEKYHRNLIRKRYPEIYKSKKIVCMYIPDEYEFMEKALVEILMERFEDFWGRKLI